MLFNNNNSDEAGGVRTSASPLALRWTFAGHDVGPPIKTNPYVTYEDQKAATYTSEIWHPGVGCCELVCRSSLLNAECRVQVRTNDGSTQTYVDIM